MEHVGIDVHKHQSQMYLLTEAGEVLHQRVHTQWERFVAVFSERPKVPILLEASTESGILGQVLRYQTGESSPDALPCHLKG